MRWNGSARNRSWNRLPFPSSLKPEAFNEHFGKGRLSQADLIVLAGFLDSGGDQEIRTVSLTQTLCLIHRWNPLRWREYTIFKGIGHEVMVKGGHLYKIERNGTLRGRRRDSGPSGEVARGAR